MPFYDIPSTPGKQKRVLARFIQENAAIAPGNVSSRRRPQPPRSVIAQVGATQVVIVWNAPQNMNNVQGFNVYRGNENNRVQNIADPTTRQATLPMPGTPGSFFISSYNSLLESVKIQAMVPGSPSGGALPSSPSGWQGSPSGGGGSGSHGLIT